MVLMRAI
jgi:hypothetical protein